MILRDRRSGRPDPARNGSQATGGEAMRAGDTRVLGRSGLAVTQLGFGGAPLGNMYRAIADAEAQATVRAAYDAGIRLFDTAPLYGFGLSEHRVGAALRDRPRESFVLSTKVGRLLEPRHPGHPRPRPVRRLAAVRRGLRLRLRRHHALDRAQPAPARHLAGRHPAGARPRRLDAWLGAGAGREARSLHGRRLSGHGEAARRRHGQGDRRRRQRDRRLPGSGRARRLRLLPARRPLHPARAGAAGQPAAAVRAA